MSLQSMSSNTVEYKVNEEGGEWLVREIEYPDRTVTRIFEDNKVQVFRHDGEPFSEQQIRNIINWLVIYGEQQKGEGIIKVGTAIREALKQFPKA